MDETNDLDITEVNDVLRGVVEHKEVFEIKRGGSPIAVIMSYDEYLYLLGKTGSA
jgi:hypothetical protein